MGKITELEALREENRRLIALLEQHGIDWCAPKPPTLQAVEPPSDMPHRSPEDKLAIFRRLFRGRSDVYPVRWENKQGKAGYSPACANEWKPGVCEKPKVKCADCGNRQWIPVSRQTLISHLTGLKTLGIYPLLPDDTCHFLAVDFDEADWRDDARAFVQSCKMLEVPVALEISRSGNGAHAWIFFDRAIAARDARRLGSAIISHTCERTRQLTLSSYDRLFPNQDSMPKGGFGNLIALPLQKSPREQGRSVFVDEHFQPWPDQWDFLANMRLMPIDAMDGTVFTATGGAHPVDVALLAEDETEEPWKTSTTPRRTLAGPLPAHLDITLANQIFFRKDQLTQPLINRLIRLAAFLNPEFYKAQAMRFNVWDKPRVIGCAENYPKHIALPRGCLEAVESLLKESGIAFVMNDCRHAGTPVDVRFVGTLRLDQELALNEMLCHDIGVLHAPTAFGKTVTAAALIAKRQVNTLILVNRIELLSQWKKRLQSFLGVGKDMVGTIGAGRAKLTGKIDVAVMQSLSRQGKVNELVENYGQVIVDECHHLSAFSFEAILKRVKARFVLGLTATPARRDGQQPIIFMQCGPIRYTAAASSVTLHQMSVIPRMLDAPIVVPDTSKIQEIFRALTLDTVRTAQVVADVRNAYSSGRKVLVLTERAEHIDILREALGNDIAKLFVLHGKLPRKQRATVIESLEALDGNCPRILLATGKLIGEGFDHPPLDTMVLAMPVSWRGTLQQYAGRLHRDHAGKTDVLIYDYVDLGHPALMRMWDKRLRGYRAMGYQIGN